MENLKKIKIVILLKSIKSIFKVKRIKYIYNELNNLFYKNILLVGKDEIQKVISKYNIIEEYSIKKIYPSTININIKPTFSCKTF